MKKSTKVRSPQVKVFSNMEEKYPEYAKAIQVADEMTVKGLNVLDKVYPVGERLYKTVADAFLRANDHHLAQIWPLLLGFVICFFGGCFAMIIAAVEVVYLTSWDTIKKSMRTIYANYLVAREASLKDDMVDDDGNGIPDVQEITRKELFSRKLGVFFCSVDPIGLREAFNALLFAFVAILAALKDSIANTVVYACGLANTIERGFPVRALIEDVLPPEHKKLSGIVTMSLLNFLAVAVATVLKRYVMTLHCALRGATMFVENGIMLGKSAQLVEEDVGVNSQRSKVLICVLACLGFLWQASNGFSVPFPLNILLFPLSLAEQLLGFAFAVSVFSGVV